LLRWIWRFATFSGRASRREFTTVFIATATLAILQFIVLGAGTDVNRSLALSILSGATSLILTVLEVAVFVRRLHDLDKSGWVLATAVVPIVGVILLIWGFARKGTVGPNRFGFALDPDLFS
jgi:uncharacterized membrane protein YhaH (DUF805 family)